MNQVFLGVGNCFLTKLLFLENKIGGSGCRQESAPTLIATIVRVKVGSKWAHVVGCQ